MNVNASGKTKRDWRTLGAKSEELLAFDRAGYFVTKSILMIAVLGSVLFHIGGPVVAAATNNPLSMSYANRVTSGITMPRGATYDGTASVDILLRDATLGERFSQALPGLLIAAMTITIAWLLFRLLLDIQRRGPFTKKNVQRINAIAVIVCLGGTMALIAQTMASNAIYATGRLPHMNHPSFEPRSSVLPLVVMFMVAILGEVFSRGIELRDDVEGLI
jgi:hypothetical protein